MKKKDKPRVSEKTAKKGRVRLQLDRKTVIWVKPGDERLKA